jgi:hypothetical protein
MEIKIEGMKWDEYKNKAILVREIAKGSTIAVLEDSKSYTLAAGVGLMQGLKYNGSFKRGIKAGTATMGAMVGVNIIQNIVVNLDEIKKA